MGWFDSLKRWLGLSSGEEPLPPPQQGHTLEQLADRLGLTVGDLQEFQPNYCRFTIPKGRGGQRTIDAPDTATCRLQRRVLRRLLSKLAVHPAANGFEHGRSIVTNAHAHVKSAVVVSMDIRDFFPSTTAKRVHAYFRRIGWNHQAAEWLVRVCCHRDALPQGAPTSPRISNLVNYRMDANLHALTENPERFYLHPFTGERLRAQPPAGLRITYTRYADDLAFSFSADSHRMVNSTIFRTGRIVKDYGYRLHTRKKLRIMRRHGRQIVTGLVVNERARLPRHTRRWLRAVRHHVKTGQAASLTEAQLAGWTALEQMIELQTGD